MNTAGRELENTVTFLVALSVIDLFKLIKVNDHQGQGRLIAPGKIQLMAKQGVPGMSIIRAGEFVCGCKLMQAPYQEIDDNSG